MKKRLKFESYTPDEKRLLVLIVPSVLHHYLAIKIPLDCNDRLNIITEHRNYSQHASD